jgi:prolyl oligopeptidase
MVQRPELYGAVVCTVPVIDMLRFHRFTVGRYWVGEYGNAELDPDHFAFMMAYSPLHNVLPSQSYPPLLLTTAETDDRVVPAHAMKFAATLQTAPGNDQPVLIRIETKAGHGLGKPTAKLIEEEADILAFLYDVLDVTA